MLAGVPWKSCGIVQSHQSIYRIARKGEPPVVETDETEIRNADCRMNGFRRVEDILEGTAGIGNQLA
jgi:hypothetical protein